MIRGVKQATGRAPRYGGVPGSTDGTILRMELGIPIVTCGPGDRLIPHQVDEYVESRRSGRGGEDLRRISSELPRSRVTRTGHPRLRALEAFPVEQEGQRCVALRDPAGFTDQIAVLPTAAAGPGLALRRRAFDRGDPRDPAAPARQGAHARAGHRRRRAARRGRVSRQRGVRGSVGGRSRTPSARVRSVPRPTPAVPMRATRRDFGRRSMGSLPRRTGRDVAATVTSLLIRSPRLRRRLARPLRLPRPLRLRGLGLGL